MAINFVGYFNLVLCMVKEILSAILLRNAAYLHDVINPLNPKGWISGQTWSVFIPERPEKRPLTKNNRIGVKLFSVYTLKAQNLNKIV